MASVLITLVLLQLLYLALIAVVLGLTWIVTAAIWNSSIPASFVTLVLFVGPPAAGLISALFLLKPLVARPPKGPHPIRLSRDDEPVLHAFVDRLCETVGSPKPTRIAVDLQVNASAGVRGWRGFFLGDLDLTIGLPLATGLSLREFTGVLAHEFGHFAQRTGLRSHFMIQTIQGWFARVVYQRDSWDAWLEEKRQHDDWRIKIVAALASVSVSASRKYLTLLMKAGAWVGSAFSRQMEFDADRYEAAVAGADAFERTSLRLPQLMAGAQLAWQDAQREWGLGRLPDNVAALVEVRTGALTGDSILEINQSTLSARTGPLDSHPATADRIDSVKRGGMNGVLTLDGFPAQLFQDLPGLCHRATAHHYTSVLQLNLDGKSLVSSDEAAAATDRIVADESAVIDFFSSPAPFLVRWLRLPSEPHAHDRSSIEAQVASEDAYNSAAHRVASHYAARIVHSAGVTIDPASFELSPLESIPDAETRSRDNLARIMDQFRDSAEGKLRELADLAHSILTRGGGIRPSDGANLAAAWRSYTALSRHQDSAFEIRCRLHTIGIVRDNAHLFRAAACANLLDRLGWEAEDLVRAIVQDLQEAPACVIFDPAAPATAAGQLSSVKGSAEEKAAAAVARFEGLAVRAIGQICWFAVAENFPQDPTNPIDRRFDSSAGASRLSITE